MKIKNQENLMFASNIVDICSRNERIPQTPMKKIILSTGIVSALLVSSASAQFIDFGSGNVKVVFNQQVVDGNVVSVATATITETDPATGATTVKRQTEKTVPSATGTGTERIVTEETTVATPDPTSPGVFSVETTTATKTTPIDESGNEGATTEEEVVELDPLVLEDDLDLPASTQFVEIDPELDAPIVISAE